MFPLILLLSLVGVGLSMDVSSDEEDDFNQPDDSTDDPIIPESATGGSLNGTDLADFHIGDASGNLILGNDGNDNLAGRGGDDGLFGGAGADTLAGDDGDDFAVGGSGDDRIYLGDGDDSSDPAIDSDQDAGNDIIHGGAGDDVIADTKGENTLIGDSGDDLLIAFDGFSSDDPYKDPREFGSSDRLDGGAGDDALLADDGDTMLGGWGSDIFVVGAKTDGSGDVVTVQDFNVDEDVFGIIYLDAPDVEPDVTYSADDSAGMVRAFVDGQEVAQLHGLTAADIPRIQSAVGTP